ncbi:MAG: YdcF family protein [Candidatus Omnitrophica bacterium]|nr:YdcF family protein [Candidatus Omnitrophota bacterium]
MKNKKSGSAAVILVLIVLIMAIILTYAKWLPYVARFLLVKDNIQKADCIVPLGGNLYSRFAKAVELYNQGYARRIVFSVLPEPDENSYSDDVFMLKVYGHKGISRMEFVLLAFEYLGKDSQNIYFTDKRVTSTYEEALATRDFMLKKGFKSLILVTSHYHMKRALMIFNSVFKGKGVTIFTCTAGLDAINPGNWWQKETDVKLVLQEYLSMAQNFIYHFLFKKERTAFDS